MKNSRCSLVKLKICICYLIKKQMQLEKRGSVPSTISSSLMGTELIGNTAFHFIILSVPLVTDVSQYSGA